jgi:hypothetical protein
MLSSSSPTCGSCFFTRCISTDTAHTVLSRSNTLSARRFHRMNSAVIPVQVLIHSGAAVHLNPRACRHQDAFLTTGDDDGEISVRLRCDVTSSRLERAVSSSDGWHREQRRRPTAGWRLVSRRSLHSAQRLSTLPSYQLTGKSGYRQVCSSSQLLCSN